MRHQHHARVSRDMRTSFDRERHRGDGVLSGAHDGTVPGSGLRQLPHGTFGPLVSAVLVILLCISSGSPARAAQPTSAVAVSPEAPATSTSASLEAPATSSTVSPEAPATSTSASLEAPPASTTFEGLPGTKHRILFSTTALPLPPKQLTITGYEVGLWHIEYGLNDHLSFGVLTNLPVCMVGAAPTIRAQTQLGDNVAIGGGAMAGVITSYLSSYSFGFFGFGMNGAVTITLDDHLINISAIVAKVGFHEEGYRELLEEILVIPTVGYSYRLSTRWQLAAEVSNPFFVMSEDLFDPGQIWLVSYGARYHGDMVTWDMGFMLPIQEDFLGALWKYMPTGVPFVSAGFDI